MIKRSSCRFQQESPEVIAIKSCLAGKDPSFLRVVKINKIIGMCFCAEHNY